MISLYSFIEYLGFVTGVTNIDSIIYSFMLSVFKHRSASLSLFFWLNKRVEIRSGNVSCDEGEGAYVVLATE